MINSANTKFQLKGIIYILISFVFWIAVEYITVWHKDFAGWMALMPWALLQYLVIILVFYFFIFRKRWNEKKLFFLMLAVMIAMELIWAKPPILIAAWFPLFTSIWGFLTFMPLWMVNRSLKKRKWPAIVFCLWIVVAAVMGTMTLIAKFQ